MTPGEIFTPHGDIEINVGRRTITLKVSNTGDRPIQIGSHYHFAETNRALAFDRARARGFRLNIAAGTAVRFEPGQARAVELVALAGSRIVYGFAGEVMGKLDTGESSGTRRPSSLKAGTEKKQPTKTPPGKKVLAKKRATKK